MVQISIDLDETLFRRLQAQAERDQKSIVQVVIDALQDNIPEDTPTSPGSALLMIAEAAEALGDMSQTGDVAERSRELLESQFAEDVLTRLNEDDRA